MRLTKETHIGRLYTPACQGRVGITMNKNTDPYCYSDEDVAGIDSEIPIKCKSSLLGPPSLGGLGPLFPF